MRIYFDACAVIYYVEQHPQYFPTIDARINDPRTQVVVSELCRMECRVRPVRMKDETLLRLYDTFFAAPDVVTAALGRGAFEKATQLRADHGLKTPDALHLAAAIEAGCDEFWTNDRRLEAAAGGQLRTLTF